MEGRSRSKPALSRHRCFWGLPLPCVTQSASARRSHQFDVILAPYACADKDKTCDHIGNALIDNVNARNALLPAPRCSDLAMFATRTRFKRCWISSDITNRMDAEAALEACRYWPSA